MTEVSGAVDRASRHTGVTGLSWFSASLEVVGALAFGQLAPTPTGVCT
jgi:hypothetical protein